MASKKIILVTGATGKQGGACIDCLLGHPDKFSLRAISRDPSSSTAAKLQAKGVEVVKGDLDDAQSVYDACHGVYGVFLVTVPSFGDSNAEQRQGIANIDAALKAGVQYFVFTSALGADSEIARRVPPWESKFQVEQHLQKAGFSDGWAIIRPPGFYENVFQFGPTVKGSLGFWYAESPNVPIFQISARDIGGFGAQCFLNPSAFRSKITEIVGETLTGKEMCQILEDLTGVPWTWNVGYTRYLLAFIAPKIAYMTEIDWNSLVQYDIELLKRLKPDGLESFRDWCLRQGMAKDGVRPAGVSEYKWGRTWTQWFLGWTGLV
ncbi:hypothetical protein HDU93_000731 [Gonapodya sp. JEL0774]|nr:hypothetical protein HDU93_000731 [Gonapodya sp. JEL0774]